MVITHQYTGELVGVLGLGRTGITSLRSLIDGQAYVIAWDDKPDIMEKVVKELTMDFAYYNAVQTERLRFATPIEQDWEQMAALLVSPGVPLLYPELHPVYVIGSQYKIPMISDIEVLRSSQPYAQYIGITGTNGKSTTTALVAHVMRNANKKVAIGGNFGTAALSLEPLKQGQSYVLEVSSFQLELCKRMHWHIAACLSINVDHLDRHGNFANYLAAKLSIFANQTESDYAIISIESTNSKYIVNRIREVSEAKIIKISRSTIIEDGVSVINGMLYDNYQSATYYDVSNISCLRGQHNEENMAAAFAIAIAAGVHPEEIIKHFCTFQPLPHRMNIVHTHNNIQFIDDSKATNANSTYWALEHFNNIYWIAGGMCKDSGIKPLHRFFDRIKHAYLIGDASMKFAKTLCDYNINHTIAGTLQAALNMIKDLQITEGNVLLSPACASFDQWENFEERGKAFAKMVKELW